MDLNPRESKATDSAQVADRDARDLAVLVFFAAALAWAFFQIEVMLALSGANLWTANPGEEGSLLHTAVESWGPGVVAVVAAGLVTVFIGRRAPRFLMVPQDSTSLRLFLSLVVTATIVVAVFLLVPIAVTMIVDPPGPHPENEQYIPIAFWIAPWAAAALTPVATILIAWRWMVHKRSR